MPNIYSMIAFAFAASFGVTAAGSCTEWHSQLTSCLNSQCVAEDLASLLDNAPSLKSFQKDGKSVHSEFVYKGGRWAIPDTIDCTYVLAGIDILFIGFEVSKCDVAVWCVLQARWSWLRPTTVEAGFRLGFSATLGNGQISPMGAFLEYRFFTSMVRVLVSAYLVLQIEWNSIQGYLRTWGPFAEEEFSDPEAEEPAIWFELVRELMGLGNERSKADAVQRGHENIFAMKTATYVKDIESARRRAEAFLHEHYKGTWSELYHELAGSFTEDIAHQVLQDAARKWLVWDAADDNVEKVNEPKEGEL